MRWLRKDVKVAGGCLYLVPLGDLHIGAEEFTANSKRRLQGYVDWIIARKNAYSFLVGDLVNCSTSVSAGRPYEEKLDGTEQFLEAKRILEPLAKTGRILGSVIGNHEAQYQKCVGTRLNRNKELCALLDIDYCGAQAFVSLNCQVTKTKRVTYDIFVTHGFGGGRKRGAKVNNLADMAQICEADAYLAGHTHDCIPVITTRWSHQNNRLIQRKVAFVICGSFLEYCQESNLVPSESYAERLALPPVRIGAPRIRFELTAHGKDIHVSI